MYLTDGRHWPEIARAHGEVFGGIGLLRPPSSWQSCSTLPGWSRLRPRRSGPADQFGRVRSRAPQGAHRSRVRRHILAVDGEDVGVGAQGAP